MVRLTSIFTSLLLITVIGGLHHNPAQATDPAPWPTHTWSYSTPEAQGMDSRALAAVIADLPTQDSVDSLIVIRNGYVIAEVYWQPFTRTMDHHWFSVSKSVIATLIGIAIDQGHISSVEANVLSFFPEMHIQRLDADKQAITIRDLLTMRSGFACDITKNTDPYLDLAAAEDSLQLALNWEMAGGPGAVFRYCELNTYLLTAILVRTTGLNVMDFAQRHLFAPLGISKVTWIPTRQGLPMGYMGLYLTPLDMAKIAYLYLQRGHWEDQIIVSEAWVSESTAGRVLLNLTTSYGFQWWSYRARHGLFFAGEGSQGQYAAVHPQKNLVVILASSTKLVQSNLSIEVLMASFVGAITSDVALPTNPTALTALSAIIQSASAPAPQGITPFPDIVSQISGQTFALNSPWEVVPPHYTTRAISRLGDSWRVTALTFDFAAPASATPTPHTITLHFESAQTLTVPIGLDGVYRSADYNGVVIAARGQWFTRFKNFNLSLRFPAASYWLAMNCTFPAKRLVCSVQSSWGQIDQLSGTR